MRVCVYFFTCPSQTLLFPFLTNHFDCSHSSSSSSSRVRARRTENARATLTLIYIYIYWPLALSLSLSLFPTFFFAGRTQRAFGCGASSFRPFFDAEQREKNEAHHKKAKGQLLDDKKGEENESIPSRSAKGHAKIEEEEIFIFIRKRPHSQHNTHARAKKAISSQTLLLFVLRGRFEKYTHLQNSKRFEPTIK